jgi:hypothetical protein
LSLNYCHMRLETIIIRPDGVEYASCQAWTFAIKLEL